MNPPMGGCFTQPYAQKSSVLLCSGGGDDDEVDRRLLHATQASEHLLFRLGGDDESVDGRLLHATPCPEALRLSASAAATTMSSKGGCFTQTKPQSAPLVRLGGGYDDLAEGRVLHANRVQKRFAVLGSGDDDVVEGRLLHAAP